MGWVSRELQQQRRKPSPGLFQVQSESWEGVSPSTTKPSTQAKDSNNIKASTTWKEIFECAMDRWTLCQEHADYTEP